MEPLDGRTRQLKTDQEASRKKPAPASRERLARVEQEMANLNEQLHALRLSLESEREPVEAIRRLKQELEQAQVELEKAEREFDFGKAAELRHGTIPRLEQQLHEMEVKLSSIQGARVL